MRMRITENDFQSFAALLVSEDRGPGTTVKYLRDVRTFAAWLNHRPLTPETAAGWKEHLLHSGYAVVTINSMLSAVNRFLGSLGREDCKLRFLRVQRRSFRDQSRDLNKSEYQRLLDTAQNRGQERLELLLATIRSKIGRAAYRERV